MIDIHCHILPATDDGPNLLSTSLEMASLAARDGIEKIIATPHTDGIRVSRRSVVKSVAALNKELQQKNIPVEVISGFEIPYPLARELGPTHTLGAGRFVLLELPHAYVPIDAAATIYFLLDRGVQPVIAHPERNMGILEHPDLLLDLCDAGAMTQLTAASVTGELGPDVEECALFLLREGRVDFIATDSHSPSFRRPVLGPAYRRVKKLVGREAADRISFHNPETLLRPWERGADPFP
ncbi:MAG: tyrosine protein phosphatase [Desulfobulbaceae bacterium]